MKISHLFSVLLVIFAAAFSTAAQDISQPPLHSSLNSLKESEIFSSARDGFSIRLHNWLGVEEPPPASSAAMGPTSLYYFEYRDALYQLVVLNRNGNIAPLSTEKEYQDFMDGQRQSAIPAHGRIISQTRIKVNGYNGVEMAMEESDKSLCFSRSIAVGMKLYMITAVIDPNDSYGRKLVTKTFDSFKLLADKPAAAPSKP